MSSDKDKDGPRLIYEKYDGRRGPEYTEWRKGFLDACEGKGDEDGSWADTLQGLDPQVGLSAAQNRRRAQRRRESFSCIMQHITDSALKDVLRAESNKNGYQALRVLDRECREHASDLSISSKVLEWHALTMAKDVGISESSIVDFNRLLTAKNTEFPAGAQYDADAMVIKFLTAINRPTSLAAEADKLLQMPKTDLPVRFYTQPVAAQGVLPAVPGGWVRREVAIS